VNILFITDNFPPEVNAPASRTFEHARRWVRAGAEVTVITCAPNFPRGQVYPGYANRLRSVESIEGIRVVRVWSYIASNEGFVRRSLDFISFAVSAFAAGLFERPDVIVATSPQFFTTFAGSALALLKRRPWVFELRDLWPESIVAVGAARESTLIRLLERIELALYRNAARIIAVSPAFKDNLVRRGIQADKVSIVTNGADLSMWLRPADAAKAKAELGFEGKFVVGYVGTHGMAHALDFIVRSAARNTDPQVHFLFVGDGAEKAEVMATAKALGAANMTFLPPVPKHEVPRILAATDVALVPLRRAETFRTVIPSKIFEAAAMRIPILLGVEGQAEEIVRRHAAGLCFVPEDEASFLAAVARLAGDAELYRSCQEGCASLAAAYDRDTLAADMLEQLRGVAA
jgi:glycosyltransferase involved in cell wall biosynthesis